MKITVEKIQEDGEEMYMASIEGYPYMTEYADTYEEAYELAQDSVEWLNSYCTLSPKFREKFDRLKVNDDG